MTQMLLANLLFGTAAAEVPDKRPRPPVPVAARGMTIGKLNAMAGVEPGLVHAPDVNTFAMTVPLRLGLTPGLEVFASPVVQSVDPVLRDPALGAIYRFNKGDVQVGARLSSDLNLFGSTQSVALQAGVPVRIRTGGVVAFDTGAHALLPLIPDTGLGVLVPAGAQLNATENLYALVTSALRVADLSATGDTLTVPLSVGVGCSVPREDVAFLDVGARGAFGDIRATESFSVVAFGRLFFYP